MKFLPKKRRAAGRVYRNGLYASALTALAIVACVLVNLLVGALPTRFTRYDITSNGLYTLGDSSRQLCSALEKDITIYYLAETGAESSILTMLLDRYADASEHLTWQQVDPGLYPGFAAQHGAEGLTTGSLILSDGESSEAVNASDLYTYDYSNYYTTGSYDTYFDGEGQITAALYSLVSGAYYTAYQVTNHGETGLGTTLQAALTKQHIALEELNLYTQTVPEDCDLLIINGPTADFGGPEALVNEIGALEAYLNAGGRLLVLTDYDVQTPNLDALLATYGLVRQTGLVVEGDANYYYYGYPDLLLPTLMDEEMFEVADFVASSSVLALPDAHAITLEEPAETVQTAALLRTSSAAYLKTQEALASGSGAGIAKEEGDATGPFVLAAYATNTETQGQIVWLASALFSQVDSFDLNGGNTEFLVGTASLLCGQEAGLVVAAKSLMAQTVVFSGAAVIGLGLLFVLVVPVAFLLVGIVITVRRRRR